MKNNGRPMFVMFVGLPASGKSTCAEELRRKGMRIFSSDELREKTGERNNRKVFSELKTGVLAALRNGEDCVLDATNLNRKKRTAFLNDVRGTGAATKCVLFVVPPEVCKARNAERANRHGVTDEVIETMLRNFESPWYSDGFDEIEVRAFDGAFEPEFADEDADAFDQDNGHHALTLGEHERKAAEYAEKTLMLTENAPFVIAAARRHDEGKMLTRTYVDAKGNPSENAHYYGHEKVGSYLFLLRGFCGGRLDVPLTEWGILYCAFLISMHMRPSVWKTSKNAEERDRLRIGDEAYADLLALGEADAFAKHPSEEDEERMNARMRAAAASLKPAKKPN